MAQPYHPLYHPIDTQHVLFLLRQWLKVVSPPAGVDWLDNVRDVVNEGAMDGAFLNAFAAVPRHVGQAPLRLTREDREDAAKARPGWHPHRWTADVAARATLLLSYDDSTYEAYADMLTGLLKLGRIETSATLYRCLPLLPYPERHVSWATAASRSDHRALFEALAVRNPYPTERFDEAAWNSLIMKAVFLGVPLFEVEGLERRANHVLAHELRDFAQQRAAAGHAPGPAVWQAVGDHATGPVLDDMARMLKAGDAAQRQAAALVLSRSRDPRARSILADHPDLRDAALAGRIDWGSLGNPSSRATL
ncbi:EboA domain-containing protein [Azospirillum sp. sgz302134]